MNYQFSEQVHKHSKNFFFYLFQGFGDEVVTIIGENIPPGVTGMYYINNYSNSSPLTWEQYEAFVMIYAPNGAGRTPVDINGNGQEKFFIVGCFTSSGYSDFVFVEQYVDTITDICP